MESLKQIKLAPSELTFEALILLIVDVRKRAKEAIAKDSFLANKKVSSEEGSKPRKSNKKQSTIKDLNMGDV